MSPVSFLLDHWYHRGYSPTKEDLPKTYITSCHPFANNMERALDSPSERQPLLPSSSPAELPLEGLPSRLENCILSEKGSYSTFPPYNHSTHFCSRSRTLRGKIYLGIIMVAIPAYLLASSAVSTLGPLFPRNTVIRSPAPKPAPVPVARPQASPQAHPANPFGSIVGPVVNSNFADPAIIHIDGISYAFATNNRGVGADLVHIQMATSTDNQTWTLLEHQDALPQVGAWETGHAVWAPDVIQLDDGSFVLYYADSVTWAPARHCVGAATSKSVTGPYIPTNEPFACPDVHTLGGAIDPDGFHDLSTNKRYVTYKVDGNSLGHGGACSNTVAPIVPTPIMLQEVGSDGLTKIGAPIEILDRDNLDGPLIEAPALHRSEEGIYFLFYSSNCFTTPLYDTAYATAPSITGPYTRAARPLFITGDGPDLVGPGGMDIIKGGNMIVFHGHLTVQNDPAREKQAQTESIQTGTPIKDIHLPLIRGMYSATATFTGNTVSLA